MAEEAGQENWGRAALQQGLPYRNDNIKYPTLQPGLEDQAPSDRFMFERNPYFYRVDSVGCSFPISTRWRLRSRAPT